MKKENNPRKFKTIIVDHELHHEMKIVVAQEQITMNDLIKKLFDEYKAQNSKK